MFPISAGKFCAFGPSLSISMLSDEAMLNLGGQLDLVSDSLVFLEASMELQSTSVSTLRIKAAWASMAPQKLPLPVPNEPSSIQGFCGVFLAV